MAKLTSSSFACGRMRVFENRVLRRIFEPKRDETSGELRKLHNEELNPLAPEFPLKF